jgi:hypothetical protein
LPESAIRRLARWLGYHPHREAALEWLWCGRRAKVVDGSTVSMPDTAANQHEYPVRPIPTGLSMLKKPNAISDSDFFGCKFSEV